MATTYGIKNCKKCHKDFWTKYPEQSICHVCIIDLTKNEIQDEILNYLAGEKDRWKYSKELKEKQKEIVDQLTK